MPVTTPHDLQRDTLLGACRLAAVASAAGVSDVVWGSTISPRVVSSNVQGYVGGLHRGRLPMIEIWQLGDQTWDRQSADGCGTMTSNWNVRVHVNGPSWSTADSLARAIALTALIGIRASDYMTVGDESFGELTPTPLGFAIDISLSLEHTFSRTDYETVEVAPPPVFSVLSVTPSSVSVDDFTLMGYILQLSAEEPIGNVRVFNTMDPATLRAVVWEQTAPDEILVTGVPLETGVAPFDMRFEVTPSSMIPVESPTVSVTDAPPPVIMYGSIFVPFTMGAGREAVMVDGDELETIVGGGEVSNTFFGVPMPQESWTFAVWFRRTSTMGDLGTFGLWNRTGIPASLISFANVVGGLAADTTSEYIDLPVPYMNDDYDWHLIVLTMSQTMSARVYWDGSLAVSNPLSPVMIMAEGPFAAGFNASPGMPGCQATPACWNRELTPIDVAALWAATIFPP